MRTEGTRNPRDSYSPFDRLAERYDSWFEEADFTTEKTVSTLFQQPENVKHTEKPRKGYSENAGFTILLAKKTGS